MVSDPVRLQRFLSQAGIASRRKAEELITAGQVRVNGRVVTELGTKVDPARDRVQVGDRVVRAEAHVTVVLNKPRGTVTTLSDPDGRPTVMDLLRDVGARLYPVGRLDYTTEGVLLLTNDGELAHALMHPSSEVQKVYRCKLRGTLSPDGFEQLQAGVTLDDGSVTAPAGVTLIGASEGGRNTWLEITLHEGKNRQIHRMAEALGHQVAKLQRVAYAGLTVDDLRPGRYRVLPPREVAALRKLGGLPGEPRESETRGPKRPRAAGSPGRPAAGRPAGPPPRPGRSGPKTEQPRAARHGQPVSGSGPKRSDRRRPRR